MGTLLLLCGKSVGGIQRAPLANAVAVRVVGDGEVRRDLSPLPFPLITVDVDADSTSHDS